MPPTEVTPASTHYDESPGVTQKQHAAQGVSHAKNSQTNLRNRGGVAKGNDDLISVHECATATTTTAVAKSRGHTRNTNIRRANKLDVGC